jgi:hypothetical protein
MAELWNNNILNSNFYYVPWYLFNKNYGCYNNILDYNLYYEKPIMPVSKERSNRVVVQ